MFPVKWWLGIDIWCLTRYRLYFLTWKNLHTLYYIYVVYFLLHSIMRLTMSVSLFVILRLRVQMLSTRSIHYKVSHQFSPNDFSSHRWLLAGANIDIDRAKSFWIWKISPISNFPPLILFWCLGHLLSLSLGFSFSSTLFPTYITWSTTLQSTLWENPYEFRECHILFFPLRDL